ncbi:ECF transporter S component [Oscillibacter sp.]|uniref:ECF transporter S component n=1 Tax=Oscillibacter sp. TaxID=1945593 RepID=UPI0028A60F5C|nr:ECF transporter S component [Oscillibacter sp.]
MQTKSLREIILSGLFIASGIILPGIFHMYGMGTSFSPMHIPVLLAGFFISIPYAIAVGALTPFLSSIFTGMPPIFPIMPYMVLELATYGAIASLLYRKLNANVYVALIGSMIAGRIVAGFAVWVLATFFAASLPGPIIFIAGTVTNAIPGIAIQLVFIPALVVILNRYNLVQRDGIRHK